MGGRVGVVLRADGLEVLAVTHAVENREQTLTGWLLTCSCGHTVEHRDAVGAERLAEYHIGLETSRDALPKERD